jgi:UDP-glucose 4-epimerase
MRDAAGSAGRGEEGTRMAHVPSSFAKKVLITGASGFIGSHLCEALEGLGAEIHSVSRQAGARSPGHVRWWNVDLVDAEAVMSLVSAIKPDVVFHLASFVSGDRGTSAVLPTFHNNLATTINLLTAVSLVGCGRIVLTGSLEEPRGSAEEVIPSSPYAASKGAAGAYARMFHALYSTPAVIARTFMVYGPGQRDLRKLVPYSIVSLLSGRALSLGTGTRKVDWIFVKDVVAGLLAAAVATGIEGQTIDVGTGTLTTVRAVVEQLAEKTAPGGPLRFGALAERPMEQVRAADVARSQQLIGWCATTPLSDGLDATISWYRDRLKQGQLDLSSIA